MGVGDPNAQTIQKLKKYRTGPQKTGGSLQDVVRTCVYVFKIADWEKVARRVAKFSARPGRRQPWAITAPSRL